MATFLSVCSGIEAASAAWLPLGWEALAYAEIEPFPCAVLAHHYPTIPNRGDMTRFQEWPDARPDVLVGGTPCQSFSVAGLRAGLDDPRGQLMLAYGAVARQYRPRWLVWENVPGVLSSGQGRDFGTFLGMLAELGYGFAYRVLDAQYFGVPQRRRRVFVVGRLGDWRRAAAVLFERHGLSGHPPPRREPGEGVAGTLEASAGRGRGAGTAPGMIAPTLSARARGGGGLGTDFDLDGGLVAYRTSPNCGAWDTGDRVDALTTGTDPASHVLAFQERGRKAGRCLEIMGDLHPALLAPDGGGRGGERNLLAGTGVRRLTPRECERLQGFPDDYTRVPYRGKPAADGPRYKALGNAMAVPVMRWIGERIQAVEAMGRPAEAPRPMARRKGHATSKP
ncbi:DNA (cytosine-5)-methyltransferase 1 [Methylomagnum ishizawai]|uniref:Cytosine-specific methyltransferase n=1 Tax=Methylomagnum ishizawai TaxID=1760988 RepID=A0A1Y6D0V4_9GAMM|nr:DNA cytosine methyltransferase [Methylomagnum ishizawai]SMF96060.1 DNA (cytosine-5)-methyltransferase 1 [Methylomagnum ishizawai]